MQHMFVGEPNCAMDLMSDGRALSGGFSSANFRRRGFKQHRVIECIAVHDGVGGRACGGQRGGGFAGKPREVLLHGLEFPDRALERDAFVFISDTE